MFPKKGYRCTGGTLTYGGNRQPAKNQNRQSSPRHPTRVPNDLFLDLPQQQKLLNDVRSKRREKRIEIQRGVNKSVTKANG